jgi:hypothetical protein
MVIFMLVCWIYIELLDLLLSYSFENVSEKADYS